MRLGVQTGFDSDSTFFWCHLRHVAQLKRPIHCLQSRHTKKGGTPCVAFSLSDLLNKERSFSTLVRLIFGVGSLFIVGALLYMEGWLAAPPPPPPLGARSTPYCPV